MDAALMKSKLGMFIHWGVYALTEYHEQVFAHKNLPHEEYEQLYLKFDPKEYDPKKWVKLAKESGMKYICITAKHHDGFCMWDTKYTDYKITNTPYGRDVLKMLADACEEAGLLLSIYYSCPDWNYEYGYNPNSTHQWKAKNKSNPDTVKLREYIKAQITELMTGYGRIYTLFWDIPPHIVDESINSLVRELQPGIFINDRGFDTGDFSTPERDFQKIGGKKFEKATEACNSVGENSWGYRKGENFYSIRYLTSSIDRVMAMGGSYLLNVGPNALGVISEDYEEKIRRVGEWYTKVSEGLEDITPDTREYGVYKNEYLVTKKGNKSYFHFFDGLISDHFCMDNNPSLPTRAVLLNTGAELDFSVTHLPFLNGFNETARIDGPELLDIRGIPVDDLAGEPIVVMVEWGN